VALLKIQSGLDPESCHVLKTRQCCESMKFWYGSGSADPYFCNGSGSGSCYFRQWPSWWLITFCSYIFSKIKSHKTWGILLDDRRIQIWEAQKHTAPTDPDPDPQHWMLSLDWRIAGFYGSLVLKVCICIIWHCETRKSAFI